MVSMVSPSNLLNSHLNRDKFQKVITEEVWSRCLELEKIKKKTKKNTSIEQLFSNLFS